LHLSTGWRINHFMWPFSRTKPVDFEVADTLRDLVSRLKSVERELEDLHAAYRRLRASAAGARAAEGAHRLPGARGDEQPLDKKAALRAKAREMAAARRSDG